MTVSKQYKILYNKQTGQNIITVLDHIEYITILKFIIKKS